MKTIIEVGRNHLIRDAVTDKLKLLGYIIQPCDEIRPYLWIYPDGLCMWSANGDNAKSPIDIVDRHFKPPDKNYFRIDNKIYKLSNNWVYWVNEDDNIMAQFPLDKLLCIAKFLESRK